MLSESSKNYYNKNGVLKIPKIMGKRTVSILNKEYKKYIKQIVNQKKNSKKNLGKNFNFVNNPNNSLQFTDLKIKSHLFFLKWQKKEYLAI